LFFSFLLVLRFFVVQGKISGLFGRLGGWKEGRRRWMDGWMDGWMDEWMGEIHEIPIPLVAFVATSGFLLRREKKGI